jgi:phage baseplate assembly protein W
MANPTLAERFTAKAKKTDLYSDFYTNLSAHPDSKQLVVNKNEDAIIRSIRNLIFTDKYERPFQPSLGSRVKNALFEDISSQTAKMLEEEIRTTIITHEPRARLLDVVITPVEEQHMYVISIVFYTVNVESPITFRVILERVR